MMAPSAVKHLRVQIETLQCASFLRASNSINEFRHCGFPALADAESIWDALARLVGFGTEVFIALSSTEPLGANVST